MTQDIEVHSLLLLSIINNNNANSALVSTSRRETVFVNVNKQFPKTPRHIKQLLPCVVKGRHIPVSIAFGPHVLSVHVGYGWVGASFTPQENLFKLAPKHYSPTLEPPSLNTPSETTPS